MAKYPADYPFRVNKVTISGDCFASTEIWSTGFFMGNTTADAVDPGSVAAAAIAGAWTTFFTSTNAHISNGYRTLQVKVSQLETDGDTDLSMVDFFDYPVPIVATGGASALPPQLALVATLTSDIQRGLASKGRMYLPGCNLSVSTTSAKLSSTSVGQMADQLKTFFDTVNTLIDAPGTVILASKGNKLLGPGPGDYSYVNGVLANVTGLRIGDVHDTQRRRREAIPETYQTKVLA